MCITTNKKTVNPNQRMILSMNVCLSIVVSKRRPDLSFVVWFEYSVPVRSIVAVDSVIAANVFSPFSNFRFRSWAKALALEEVMSRAGADRVPRAQLQEVFDEWLRGNLDVSSSGEMRKIVEAREFYASVFLALALGGAALRVVQLQLRRQDAA